MSVSDPLKFDSPTQCPDEARHTRGPRNDYFAWHEWAEKKAKTHRQERCPTCGFWVVWKPKRKKAA